MKPVLASEVKVIQSTPIKSLIFDNVFAFYWQEQGERIAVTTMAGNQRNQKGNKILYISAKGLSAEKIGPQSPQDLHYYKTIRNIQDFPIQMFHHGKRRRKGELLCHGRHDKKAYFYFFMDRENRHHDRSDLAGVNEGGAGKPITFNRDMSVSFLGKVYRFSESSNKRVEINSRTGVITMEEVGI